MKKMKLFVTNAHLFKSEKRDNKNANLITKSTQIYKTKNNYKIVTLYKRETGSYIISNPIVILPKDIDIEYLCESILNSLNASRLISETEEDLFDINLLKELKETSYSNLYKNSNSCTIYVENEEIIIKPNIYRGSKEGLTTDTERIVTLEFLEEKYLEITKVIIEILN